MMVAEERARAHALVDRLFGPPDEAANWAVDVMHAYAAAVAWVHTNTGCKPTPPSIAEHLISVSKQLRRGASRPNPAAVMMQAAVDAVAEHRAAVA